MNNAAHHFANKVVAENQFTNGSDSSLSHLIIGNSTAEIKVNKKQKLILTPAQFN